VQGVLLVDDLGEALDLLEQAVREAFSDQPLVIARADGVASGRGQIARQTFDLALVDLHLGDGHGSEVIAELARVQPGCMVVVATIFDDDDHLFQALQAGAQGYVLKDRAPTWLASQLRGIGAGQPPLSPAIARRLIRHFQARPAGSGSASALTPTTSPRDAGRADAAPPRATTSAIRHEPLTAREREVLGLLAKGVNIADIARVLGISRHTVGDHVKHLYRKLNLSRRAEAALEARDRGLT
jgi:DNA-binding NarL/FixJ family response regulator